MGIVQNTEDGYKDFLGAVYNYVCKTKLCEGGPNNPITLTNTDDKNQLMTLLNFDVPDEMHSETIGNALVSMPDTLYNYYNKNLGIKTNIFNFVLAFQYST